MYSKLSRSRASPGKPEEGKRGRSSRVRSRVENLVLKKCSCQAGVYVLMTLSV